MHLHPHDARLTAVKIVRFETYDGHVWYAVKDSCVALETDRDNADMLTLHMADGRREYWNPVRRVSVVTL